MFRLIFVLFTLLFSNELTSISSLRADFKQITFQHKREIVYLGKIIAIKEGGRTFAKWIYSQPLQKEVYINTQGVIIYEPRLFQVTYAKKSLDILGILNRAKPVGQDGDKKIYRLENNGIDYEIISKNGLVDSIRYKDELENHIEIRLSNITLDSKIPLSIFNFTPPEGVDIIKQN